MQPAEQHYEHSADLPHAADAVWQLLAQLDHPDVAAGFLAIEVEGRGVGAIRTLLLPREQGCGMLRERIERFDPAERRYAYRMLVFGGFPFAAYEGDIHVEVIGEADCRLTYRSRYRPLSDAAAAECAPIAAGSVAQLVANLRRILERNAA